MLLLLLVLLLRSQLDSSSKSLLSLFAFENTRNFLYHFCKQKYFPLGKKTEVVLRISFMKLKL